MHRSNSTNEQRHDIVNEGELTLPLLIYLFGRGVDRFIDTRMEVCCFVLACVLSLCAIMSLLVFSLCALGVLPIQGWIGAASFAFVVSVVLFPLAACFGLRLSLRSIRHLLAMYLSITIYFTIVYVYVLIASDYSARESSTFENYHSIWSNGESKIDFEAISNSIFDMTHFSIVNSLSLGDQDLRPKSLWIKVIADIQKVVSFSFVVVGLGHVLSNKRGA